MCVSTVRVFVSGEMPQTSWRRSVRENTRPGMLDEDREELVLERPQRELGAVDDDAVARRIDLEAAPLEALSLVARAAREASLVRATGEALHAHHELAHAERLHDVVVGADLEAEDAVVLVAARGEHEDRGVGHGLVGAQAPAHLHARESGSIRSSTTTEGLMRAAASERLRAVLDGLDLEARIARG